MKIFFTDHRFGLILISLLIIASLLGCNYNEKPSSKNEYTNTSNYVSKVWKSDNEDGTYTNPILNADYSDPDVIRVGDDYFMTASSFNCSPGLPILHSKDIVNWKIVNYALPHLNYKECFDVPQHGKGVWAPSIKFHNGAYYIYWGDPDWGIYMVKTNNPFGKWSNPVLVKEAKGVIDPSPLWDEDGNVYLVTAWAASRANINSVLTIWEMNAEGTKIISEGKHVFDGHENHHTAEGPKLYKKDDYYYIFAPAGGVSTGWQLVLRSKDIYGPYKEKVVLAQGKTDINGPHQGAWVETQTGESWFVHFQEKGAYGRILHLQPVNWVEGWPVMGIDNDGDGCGEPVLTYKKPNVGKNYPINTPAESDEFNDGKLGLQWQWAANHSIKWMVHLPGQDYLRLLAYPKPETTTPLWMIPNLLMQKFPAPEFTATTKLKLTLEWEVWQSKMAGLTVMGNDYAYLALAKDEEGYKVELYNGSMIDKYTAKESLEAAASISSNEVFFRVDVAALGLCSFSYSEDGTNFKKIGMPHQAQPELWIGAKVGLFCTADPRFRMGGYADFDWFRIDELQKK
ncbi:glycoside hydrolase 43 family protein [Labilibaculum manganireducens]|uniref:glycoside hydrolase family 43 protein n=1 Tax=Labilibaculum manganireducens TaxID=1940525 RepID=UPI0029F5451C|nr:glycoside hydrolase 43 family protein [Labilibaculum manganireducens]